jgi:hypothetical protein
MTVKKLFIKTNIGAAVLGGSIVLAAVPVIVNAGQTYPSAMDASPDVYRVLAESKQFRVVVATWKPGQEDNFHHHTADRVSLYETDCKLRLSKPDGSYRDVNPKAGTAKARTGKPVKAHKARNIGDNVCILRIVEVR